MHKKSHLTLIQNAGERQPSKITGLPALTLAWRNEGEKAVVEKPQTQERNIWSPKRQDVYPH